MSRALCMKCGAVNEYRGRRGFRLAEVPCRKCGEAALKGWRRADPMETVTCRDCGRPLHQVEARRPGPPQCFRCQPADVPGQKVMF